MRLAMRPGKVSYFKGSVSRDFLGPFLACMDRSTCRSI